MSKDKVYFEGEFDSDDGGRTPTAVRFCMTNLAANLRGTRLYNPLKPLRDVYVLPAVDGKVRDFITEAYKRWDPTSDHYKWDTSRYNRLKPEWVRAFMTKDDLKFSKDQASLMKRNSTLAKIIRARGWQRIGDEPEYDDCGHVVAKWLGGPFVDYNLFPQSFALNRGSTFWGTSNFNLWKAMEMFMYLWLRLKGKNPKVEWTVRHYYKDTTMIDRPSETKFSVRFLAGVDDEDDKEDNGKDVVRVVRHLFNTSDAALQSKKTQIRVSETYEVLSGLCVRNAKRAELLKCLLRLVKEIEVELEEKKIEEKRREDEKRREEEKKREDERAILRRTADLMINPTIGAYFDVLAGDHEKAKERVESSRDAKKGWELLLGGFGGFRGK